MATQKNNKFQRITAKPEERLVCKMSLPAIISMLITVLYNIVDTFFVGRIGNEAPAGVGLALPLAIKMYSDVSARQIMT